MTTEGAPAPFIPSTALSRQITRALDCMYDYVVDIVRSDAEDSDAPDCVTQIAHLEIMAAFARSLGLAYDASGTEALYQRYIRAVQEEEEA